MSKNAFVRPGRVESPPPSLRLVVHFPNSAQGNLAVQLVGTLGVHLDRLGVTPPDRLEGRQGMILSIPCIDEGEAGRVEAALRGLAGTIRREPTAG